MKATEDQPCGAQSCSACGEKRQLGPAPTHLQDEDEVVHGPVALVEIVLCGSLVLLVVLQFLDDMGVFEEPQEDLLREVGRFEGFDFWGRREGKGLCDVCGTPPIPGPFRCMSEILAGLCRPRACSAQSGDVGRDAGVTSRCWQHALGL